jgi:hypothetical protein
VTRRSVVDARLDELYAEVPGIPDCDGSCWVTCGPVHMSQREHQRIREAGVSITDWLKRSELPAPGTYTCEALTSDRRCGVYDVRPMPCRLMCVMESWRCARGCVPEGGFMSDRDGVELLAESYMTGGGPTPGMTLDELTDMLAGELRKAGGRC